MLCAATQQVFNGQDFYFVKLNYFNVICIYFHIVYFFFFLNDPPPPEFSPFPLHAAFPLSTGATVGRVVETRRIQELPLNGRNALSLTLLTPSVKSNAGSTNTGFTDRGTAISSISINGEIGRAHV